MKLLRGEANRHYECAIVEGMEKKYIEIPVCAYCGEVLQRNKKGASPFSCLTCRKLSTLKKKKLVS